MKLLIVGHSCAPGLGSEPGFTWNWACEMSKSHEVWVIAHPEYRHLVDGFVASHPSYPVHFVWVVPKSWLDYWTPGANQERGIRLHYWLWMKAAYSEAEILYEKVHFDLVHHVSLSTMAVPPPFWRIPVPAVWGPVGGGQLFPPAFVRYLHDKRAKELLRSLNILSLPFLPALRRCVRSARLVLATNFETKRLLERAGAKTVKMFLDCGVDGDIRSIARQVRREQLTLLWAGRIEPQKGLSIAVHALAACKNPRIRLLVAGIGTEQRRMKGLVRELGVTDQVEFLGRVAHERIKLLFQNSDAFVFTSLRDSFGSVVLEALAHGLPVVALDHQGVAAFVPDDAAMKIPVRSPNQAIEQLAHALNTLESSSELLSRMSTGALSFAKAQTWTRRSEVMNELYVEAMKAPGKPASSAPCGAARGSSTGDNDVQRSVGSGGGLRALHRETEA